MSGTVKTLRGKLSDGTIVEVRNAAKWDVYSFVQRGDGTWGEGLRGSSFSSVRSRSITQFGSRKFEVVYMTEIIPAAMEKYFDTFHPEMAGSVRINEVFIQGVGWVAAIPGGVGVGSVPTDKPFRVATCRPTISFLRLLATYFHVTSVNVGPVMADFKISELGLRIPKNRLAA